MFPYQARGYRQAIRLLVEAGRSAAGKVTYRRLAAAAGIQATYFSNVLRERAQFNADQLFRVCQALGLTEEQRDFLLLLLEWERSQVPERRDLLAGRLDQIREENTQTQKHLKAQVFLPDELRAASYYLDPMVQVVHVHLTVAKYAKVPSLIRERLGMSSTQFQHILALLEDLGIIAPAPSGRGGYEVRIQNRHLPQSHPVCSPHQVLLRMRSLEQIQQCPPAERYGVSVTFSGTPALFEEIRREFLDFLKRAEERVRKCDGSTHQEVFQMNYDLFPWSKSV